MSGERYVGERRALRHFLAELQPLVIASLGENALLRYRIDRALKVGDLDSLRQARETFHNQPDNLKRRLMRGIFEGPLGAGELSAAVPVDKPAEPRKPSPTVRFDAFPAAQDEDIVMSAELDQSRVSHAPVEVRIKPGALPRSTAEALRRIADWIERDRRLLSERHWRDAEHVSLTREASPTCTSETVDQA